MTHQCGYCGGKWISDKDPKKCPVCGRPISGPLTNCNAPRKALNGKGGK